jgi:TorA maturation chaperone TorD
MFMEENVPANLHKLMNLLDPAFADKTTLLQNAFEESNEEQLKVDHAALLVGPFGLQAPPYGSVYLEKSGTVIGETTVAVQHFYDRYGLSLDIQEPADHIAIEMEFMSLLAAREAKAKESKNVQAAGNLFEAQTQFFQNFMLWMPEFSNRIEHHAQTEYYRTLGQCLSLFYAYCKKIYLTQTIEP